MVQEGKIWIGSREDGTRVYLLPEMAARHGLIAGATGTGKTVTLKVLSEAFSDLGVPVFLSDVKGDLAGMVSPAADSEDMQRRIQKFGLAQAGFEYKGYPAEFFDIYGKRGIQLRTTVSEMGPLLLSRILGLNDTQSALLSIAFQIADAENLLLIDIKDLKALLNSAMEGSARLRSRSSSVPSRHLRGRAATGSSEKRLSISGIFCGQIKTAGG